MKGEKSDEDMNISTKENSDTSSKSACLEFENISLDLLKWNILIKQIEDLSLLSSVLSQKPLLEVPQLPVIAIEAESLTVIKLLDKGKGNEAMSFPSNHPVMRNKFRCRLYSGIGRSMAYHDRYRSKPDSMRVR